MAARLAALREDHGAYLQYLPPVVNQLEDRLRLAASRACNEALKPPAGRLH